MLLASIGHGDVSDDGVEAGAVSRYVNYYHY